MSSFKPGSLPPGVEVRLPVWQTLTPVPPPRPQRPAPRPAAPAPTPAPAPAADPAAELDRARLEAARILQEAAAEAEKAEAAAREQGFAQGRQEGLEAGRAEVEAMKREAELALANARLQGDAIRQAAESQATVIRLEAEKAAQATLTEARAEAQRIIDEARQEARQRLDESQAALVELAVAAATRLVQGHLALQPQSIVQMVAAGLRLLRDAPATVRVSPEDLPLLEAQRSTLERELGAGSLTLTPDASLQRGSYLVNTPVGHVDGTLEHQAERLQAAMRAALGGSDT